MLRVISTLVKIVVASLLVGLGLDAVDMSARDLLARMDLTPEQLLQHALQGMEWALPNIILGSFVILPVWLLSYLFRPPGG